MLILFWLLIIIAILVCCIPTTDSLDTPLTRDDVRDEVNRIHNWYGDDGDTWL
jgi:hypothetical protein